MNGNFLYKIFHSKIRILNIIFYFTIDLKLNLFRVGFKKLIIRLIKSLLTQWLNSFLF